MKLYPNHVAVLVRSVQRAAERLRCHGFQIGPEGVWDGEGTREIYVERGKTNSLLLMEPIRPGAYQRAMDKRGPGLHHLAIDVLSIEEFLRSIQGSGWLLHPISIDTLSKTRTTFLARPGFPALIEVQEREASELRQAPFFVDRISIPVPSTLAHLTAAIGMEGILLPGEKAPFLSLAGIRVDLQELVQ